MRKKSIKNYIEQQFNWANKVMPTGEEVREKVKQLPDLPDWSVSTLSPPRARDPFSVEYTERVQSFFPTCEFDKVFMGNDQFQLVNLQVPSLAK